MVGDKLSCSIDPSKGCCSLSFLAYIRTQPQALVRYCRASSITSELTVNTITAVTVFFCVYEAHHAQLNATQNVKLTLGIEADSP